MISLASVRLLPWGATPLTTRRACAAVLGSAAACFWAVGALAEVPLDLSDPSIAPGTQLKNIDDTSTNRWGISLGNYFTGTESGAAMPTFITDFTVDGQGNSLVANIDGKVNVIDSNGQLKATLALNLPDRSNLGDALDYGLTSVALHPDFYNVGTAGYGKLYTIESGNEPNVNSSNEAVRASAPDWYRSQADFDSEYDGYAPFFAGKGYHRSVVNEYTFADPNTLDASTVTKREVLSTHQSHHGHNLGDLIFDPTANPGDDDYGLLYISSADKGNGSGFELNSSSVDNVYGAILRIDPIVPTGGDTATRQTFYGVDPDKRADDYTIDPNADLIAKFAVPIGISANPFNNNDGQIDDRDLVVTTGLRNPYRISIDPVTGEMWSSDTGQLNIETVDKLAWGGDHGWGLLEGDFFYLQNARDQVNAPTWIGGLTQQELENLQVVTSLKGLPNPTKAQVEDDNFDTFTRSLTTAEIDRILGATRPEFQYDHTDGASSIGGFVYRGEALPELYGKVLFAEFQGKVDPDSIDPDDDGRNFDRLGGRLLYGDPSFSPGDPEYGQIYEFIIDPNGDGTPFRILGLEVDSNGEPIIYGVDFDEFGTPIGSVLTVKPVLGDVNIDGKLTQDDVLAFVAALVNRQDYIDTFSVRPELRADFNGDGLFNFDDINPFADALNIDSQAIFALVPEPTALLSMALLAPLALSRQRKRRQR